MRFFNTEGACHPDEHYMVDLTTRFEKLQKMADEGKYFVIHKGRQCGKTTMLMNFVEYLGEKYYALFVDFQMISESEYRDEETFVSAFSREMIIALQEIPEKTEETQKLIRALEALEQGTSPRCFLADVFRLLSRWCEKSDRPVLLIIDEVDSAADHQVFLDFLSMLRGYYLQRKRRPIFKSVILSGVYELRDLKHKLRPETEHRYNSPWNIASIVDIDMEFHVDEISCMLKTYRTERGLEFDEIQIACRIYEYTSGYPYLVCWICKYIDEVLSPIEKKNALEAVDVDQDSPVTSAWTGDSIIKAVKKMLSGEDTLFSSLQKRVEDYPELKDMLYQILYEGKTFSYNTDNFVIHLAKMFAFISDDHGRVKISNRIFETRLYDMFVAERQTTDRLFSAGAAEKNQFIDENGLNMRRILERFVVHYQDIYGNQDKAFHEKEGRKFFLFYLKPIINGVGNYYVEAETRDETRTDVIVDYLGKQYVIEMKIWRGNAYHERGEEQLFGYLDHYHLDRGYMLSFCFMQKKEVGVREVDFRGKHLIEAVV